jgi:hypothetical protein
MSDRERWIVYPLLFLTLGIALRNQFFPTRQFGAFNLRAGEVTAQSIRCNQLVVNQEAECREVLKFKNAAGDSVKTGTAESSHSLTGLAECRILQVVSQEGKPMVVAGEDPNSKSGVLQTQDSRGQKLVQLRAIENGGMVAAYSQGEKVLVAIGSADQNPGVYVQYPKLGSPAFLLTPKVRLEVKPAPTPSNLKTPPEQKPAEEKKKEEGEKKEDEKK